MGILLSLIIFMTSTAVHEPMIKGSFSAIDDLASAYSIEKCAECHFDVHEEWSQAMHSKSIVDPRVLKTWRTYILKGLDPSSEADRSNLKDACIWCHAPQIKDATDELAGKIADMVVTAVEDKDREKREHAVKLLSGLSVNCIVCHMMKGAPEEEIKGKTIYSPNGKGELPHKEALGFDTVKSDLIPTPEFCAQCHHGCPEGMPSTECPTVYSSYKEEYLTGGGEKKCQDCHMRDDKGISHRFPGIYDKEILKSGISFDMEALPTTYVYHLENRMAPAVVLKFHVKNTGGHLIPHG